MISNEYNENIEKNDFKNHRSHVKGGAAPAVVGAGVLGAILVVGGVVSLALIPVYLNSSSNTDTLTTTVDATVGTTSVSSSRILTLSNGTTIDTTTTDTAITNFFTGQGANSVTVNYAETSTGSNTFNINCILVFIETFTAGLSQTQRESQSRFSDTAITNIFSTAISNLTIPSPSGFSVSKFTDINSFGISTQRSGGGSSVNVTQAATTASAATTEAGTTSA